MNKIELNNKLRRFFTRFGGGGTKPLTVKPISVGGNSDDGEGIEDFNVNDIALASDLVEKLEALPLEGTGRTKRATTDWTFEDICIQDFNGILKNAFENPNGIFINFTELPENPENNKAYISESMGSSIQPVPEYNVQMIEVFQNDGNGTWYIYYDKTDGKYKVVYQTWIM